MDPPMHHHGIEHSQAEVAIAYSRQPFDRRTDPETLVKKADTINGRLFHKQCAEHPSRLWLARYVPVPAFICRGARTDEAAHMTEDRI